MTKRTKTRRKYCVTCTITLTTEYEIEAVSAKKAEELAYTQGILVEREYTTDVEALALEKIETFSRSDEDEGFEALLQAQIAEHARLNPPRPPLSGLELLEELEHASVRSARPKAKRGCHMTVLSRPAQRHESVEGAIAGPPFDRFLKRWERQKMARMKANSFNRAAILAALAAAGIGHVWVALEGENGCGELESIAAYIDNTKPAVPLPMCKVMLADMDGNGDNLKTREALLSEGIEALCYGYLDQEHEGWADGSGGCVAFLFCVTEQRIEMDFNARVTGYVLHRHVF